MHVTSNSRRLHVAKCQQLNTCKRGSITQKVVCHPGLRGFELLSGSTCDRVFVWKNTGKCSAICSELWFSEMLCISLNAESSSCMVLEEGAPKQRKDMTRASRICLSCIVLEPDSYHCTPTWWLHLPTQLQQE